MNGTDRRTFIARTTSAVIMTAAGAVPRVIHAAGDRFARVSYRDLGSTGFRASEIGYGVLHINDPELIHAAIDAGINYFDTAHSYMNGVCEETLGTVLVSRRDEVFVTTKTGWSEPDRVRQNVETSLRRLQTDHVDMLMLHGAGNAKTVLNDDIMGLFDEFRRKGMTRFVGLSTHNHTEVPDAVIRSGFWQALLIPYNYFSPPETAAAIERVRKAGIGVIGMKNLITIERPRKPYPDIRSDKNGPTTNQQALLTWALDNPYIDSVVPGISSFEHLADDVAVMGRRLGRNDRAILRRYAENARGRYCGGIAGCDGCAGQCPRGVTVSELNRCINYAIGYGDADLARVNHDALPPDSRITACDSCEECMVRCRNGIDLAANIRTARRLFA